MVLRRKGCENNYGEGGGKGLEGLEYGDPISIWQSNVEQDCGKLGYFYLGQRIVTSGHCSHKKSVMFKKVM